MRLMPIVYVTDPEVSLPFYLALGFELDARDRHGIWIELRYGDALFALHRAIDPLEPPSGRLQLSFDVTEALEETVERMRAAGLVSDAPIIDEAYGRSLQLYDPDGLPITILEQDRELYT